MEARGPTMKLSMYLRQLWLRLLWWQESQRRVDRTDRMYIGWNQQDLVTDWIPQVGEESKA